MTGSAVVSLVLGGGLVAALATNLFTLWRDRLNRQAALEAERREERRRARESKRSRLAPLYAAAVRSAGDIASAEHQKTHLLSTDDEETRDRRIADLNKKAQARLNEVGVPLELEIGAEAFNARFEKFRQRYIRKVTAVIDVGGVKDVNKEAIQIDLFDDVNELKAIAKEHLHRLESHDADLPLTS